VSRSKPTACDSAAASSSQISRISFGAPWCPHVG
jgi:hypothetical protein